MNRLEWKKLITEAADDAGTYRPFFEAVVDTLAGILERRDEAEKAYEESGEGPMVGSASNGILRKNPTLLMINELNRDALAYWRDLGLTPAGYKKLISEGEKVAAASFERLLEKIV